MHLPALHQRHLYKDKDNATLWTTYAEKDCRAKTLHLAGYGNLFSGLLRVIEKKTADEIECTKIELDALTPEQRRSKNFEISKACKKRK